MPLSSGSVDRIPEALSTIPQAEFVVEGQHLPEVEAHPSLGISLGALCRLSNLAMLLARAAYAKEVVPLGLHPGATPASSGVQKDLIFRGFLEAVLLLRRGSQSIPIER